MAKFRKLLAQLLLRRGPLQTLVLILAIVTIFNPLYPRLNRRAAKLSRILFMIAKSSYLDRPFWALLCWFLAYLVVIWGMLLRALVIGLSPQGRHLWQLARVLVPLGIGFDYLWDEWYSNSSAERKGRRMRRTTERLAHPTQGDREMGTVGGYLCTVLLAVPFYFAGKVLQCLPYSLLALAIGLLVQILLPQPLSMMLAASHRYSKKRLTSMDIHASPTNNILPLPLEIWKIIIAFSLDVPEYFATSCEAAALPHFLAYHRTRPPSLPIWDPYRQSIRTFCQLKLVSRTWRNLVSKYAPPLWYTGPFDLNDVSEASIIDYRRVDMYYKLVDGFNLYRPPNVSLMGTKSSPRTVLAVDGDPSVPGDLERMLILLQRSPDSWRGVESFAYSFSSPSHDLLSKISTTFASLGTLILESTILYGNKDVFLPNLHTLDLTVDDCNLADWPLPKLQYLSLTIRRPLSLYSADTPQDSIVPLHFESLEALVLNREIVTLNSALWSRFPNLRLLGCANFFLIDEPPFDHPIRHLYVNRRDIYYDSPEQFSRIFGILKERQGGSRSIYLHPPTPYIRQSPYADQWRQFYVESRKNGVVWKPISPFEPSVRPDHAWTPLIAEDMAGKLERLLVDWALELYFAVVLAMKYCYIRPFLIQHAFSDIIPLIHTYFLYSWARGTSASL